MVGHRHLKPACLPIPALPHRICSLDAGILYRKFAKMSRIFFKFPRDFCTVGDGDGGQIARVTGHRERVSRPEGRGRQRRNVSAGPRRRVRMGGRRTSDACPYNYQLSPVSRSLPPACCTPNRGRQSAVPTGHRERVSRPEGRGRQSAVPTHAEQQFCILHPAFCILRPAFCISRPGTPGRRGRRSLPCHSPASTWVCVRPGTITHMAGRTPRPVLSAIQV